MGEILLSTKESMTTATVKGIALPGRKVMVRVRVRVRRGSPYLGERLANVKASMHMVCCT